MKTEDIIEIINGVMLRNESGEIIDKELHSDLVTAIQEKYASQSKWISVEDAKKIFDAGRNFEYADHFGNIPNNTPDFETFIKSIPAPPEK